MSVCTPSPLRCGDKRATVLPLIAPHRWQAWRKCLEMASEPVHGSCCSVIRNLGWWIGCVDLLGGPQSPRLDPTSDYLRHGLPALASHSLGIGDRASVDHKLKPRHRLAIEGGAAWALSGLGCVFHATLYRSVNLFGQPPCVNIICVIYLYSETART